MKLRAFHSRLTILLSAAFCSVAQLATACLWDRDTIAMERARFPGTAEVITGNFPRHSREFYEWRKAQSEAALARDPNALALYDDLAVARHKLGDHRGAIETMEAKEKIRPGLYETYSNLGTFHIYTGELDLALHWIDRALAINPDAHFGREKYQRWLVEWVKAGKPQGDPKQVWDRVGFAWFLGEKIGFKRGDNGWEQQREPALKGLLGMMRFADFNNPLLLEALGDVLASGGQAENAIHLAAQAYLFAAQGAADDGEKMRLKLKAKQVGSETERFQVAIQEKALSKALAEGLNLAFKVQQDEAAWIKAGKDANAEFEKKYLHTTK